MRRVIVISSLLLILPLRRTEIISPTLSCEETKAWRLITLPMDCKAFPNDNSLFACTNDIVSRKGVKWSISVLLEELNLFRSAALKTNVTNCVKLRTWSGDVDDRKYFFDLFFQGNMTVGVVKKTCEVNSHPTCSIEMKLRDDILALPPLATPLDELSFWNFSSVLFGANRGWLKGLEAKAAVDEHCSYSLPGIAGSSIKELWLSGSFGWDADGPLPHLDHLPLLDSLTMANLPIMDLFPENLTGTEHVTYVFIVTQKMPQVPPAINVLKSLRAFTFVTSIDNFTLVPEVFDGLNNLTSLRMGRTHIDHWTGIFPRLASLTELSLNNCGMRIFNGAYSDFPKTRILDLSSNLLCTISSDAFAGLKNIEVLSLEDNFLFELSYDAFINLRNLSTLYLNHNNLNKWPTFPNNYFFKILVSHNNLTTLKNLGKEIKFIEYLDISENKISYWKEKDVFARKRMPRSRVNEEENFTDEYQAWTRKVKISNNNIAYFSDEMLDSLNILKVVDLGGNIINCDCKTSLFQHWLATTNVTVENEEASTLLTCYQPTYLKGKYVQDINFDDICFTPRRRLWLGLGVSLVVLIITITTLGGVFLYYRTELAYLLHLARIRSISKRTTQETSGCVYDAFVCYSGKNRKWVLRRLTPLLEHPPESYRLCLFDRDFRLGSHIVNNIVDAIDQSRKVIVILTKDFIESKWCQWEMEMANHKLFGEDREFLVLVELEALERRCLPRLLRFLLATRPVVRWPRRETAPRVLAAAAELRQALGPSLRQRPCPQPFPPPFAPTPSSEDTSASEVLCAPSTSAST